MPTSYEDYAFAACAAWDRLFVAVGNPDTASGSDLSRSLDAAVEASDGTVETFDVADGSARAFTIPGGSLVEDTWEIRVIAYNDGVMSGDLESGSTMEVRAAVTTSPTVFVVEPVRIQTVAFTGAPR